ncbi:hypothetical protein [Nocardioides sp.]|uniref:hypothetical protein n=1 Tax=Nocardioides sp. TaxID=35761 RepID=UPI003528051C
MTWLDLTLAAGLLLALAAAVALAVALRRARRDTGADLAATRAESEGLRERLDELESRLERDAPPAAPDTAADTDADGSPYVITALGEPGAPEPAARIEGRLFADLLLRETVVKAAGLAHGVRRATSPENRFRMRYAYTREVKAARKRRRAELRRLRRTAGATARRQARGDAA